MGLARDLDPTRGLGVPLSQAAAVAHIGGGDVVLGETEQLDRVAACRPNQSPSSGAKRRTRRRRLGRSLTEVVARRRPSTRSWASGDGSAVRAAASARSTIAATSDASATLALTTPVARPDPLPWTAMTVMSRLRITTVGREGVGSPAQVGLRVLGTDDGHGVDRALGERGFDDLRGVHRAPSAAVLRTLTERERGRRARRG